MANDDLYQQAASDFGTALERFVHSYEADPDARRDLLQEIHFALWRSLEAFRGQCALRTWVYRIAHNVSISHVIKRRRVNAPALRLEDFDEIASAEDPATAHVRQDLLQRVYAVIQRLRPIDREIVLLYLEGLSGAEIAEISGVSAGNVATKIHRIKKILAARFAEGNP